MFKVAVSPLLTNVREYLEAQGMDVVDFDDEVFNRSGFSGDLLAIVVSGGDMNLLGIEDVELDVPVIDASGRTPEEISMEIERFS